MLNWIKGRWALVRSTIAAGDVAAFERRYLPTALAAGAVCGAVLATLNSLLAVLIILAGGIAIGYAARAYLSYRRRMAYLSRNGGLY